MNTLGHLFKVTSFGESHGEYVGCVIEGCPAGLILDVEKIQLAVDKRKTGKQDFASARNEADKVEIISGIFEGKTLGSPICILIKNKDAQSADYDALKNVYRPGHADYTMDVKYGHRDHRGGGRSSIRVTAPLVAAGEIANQLLQLQHGVDVIAYVCQIGKVQCELSGEHFDKIKIEKSPVRCPNEFVSNEMIALIEKVKLEGDTLGGKINVQIKGLPVGFGEPLFGKLQASLAHAMMSINTVKGFEYGDGFLSAEKKGSENNDIFTMINGEVHTMTNHNGGILGGISNGMDINFSVAFKPISSIAKSQLTITKDGEKTQLEIKGRHDVCAVPRAIPIVEAYTSIILADAFLQHKLNKI